METETDIPPSTRPSAAPATPGKGAALFYLLGGALGVVLGLIGGLSLGGGAVLVLPVLAGIAGVAIGAVIYRMLADTWPVLLFFCGFFAFIAALWMLGEALF